METEKPKEECPAEHFKLAMDKPVIAFGQLEKSGMYEPLIRCATILDLELVLKEFEI